MPSASRTVARILVPIGGLLVLLSQGSLQPLSSLVFTAGTMFVWTVLLPRLTVLRPLAPYFASHALAVGLFWATLAAVSRWWVMVGPAEDQVRLMWIALGSAVVSGVVGLLIGLGLNRLVQRGGERTRRGLATTAIALLAVSPLLCAAVAGDAPMEFERLHDVPVVTHLGPAERDAEEPLALVRWPDGSFVVAPPGGSEALVAAGPGAVSHRRCAVIPAGVGIEVRRFGSSVIYSADGALDMDSTFVTGCAFDAATAAPTEILVRDLERPISTGMRFGAFVVAAFAVAFVHLVLAALASRRAARFAAAKEGMGDGTGRVVLADGTELRCRMVLGPVLVEPRPPVARGYRDDAAETASVLALGSRAANDATLHRAECTAWVGVISTLGTAALAMLGAVIGGSVVPL